MKERRTARLKKKKIKKKKITHPMNEIHSHPLHRLSEQ